MSTKVGRRLRPRCAVAGPRATGCRSRLLYDYSYDGVLRSLEDSLQRLGLCRVDIVLIHDVNPRWHGDDYERRFTEAMDGAYRALERLRGEGVVRAIGVGVKGADVCLRFAHAGDFDCFMLAGGYTLLEHAALDAFLPHCEANGIAVIVASPFNSGILATGVVEGARFFYPSRRRTTCRRGATARGRVPPAWRAARRGRAAVHARPSCGQHGRLRLPDAGRGRHQPALDESADPRRTLGRAERRRLIPVDAPTAALRRCIATRARIPS